MRRSVAGLLLVALAAGPAAAARADDRPRTIPALQRFTATGGEFELGTRVVVRPAEADALRGEARTLAGDLSAVAGRTIRVTSRRGVSLRAGDVLLTRRHPSDGLGGEGYTLRVGRFFTITAAHNAGIYYGGRTLFALVRSKARIPRGTGRDVPRYEERGMMIDCGRVFYPRAWFEERIRQLSDLKLNLLHLHLSDDQGFRIETPSHPEIDTKPFLSRADVRAMVAEARRRHVTIVPEVDMPGHLKAALAKHPELQLRDILGQAQPDKLDVTLPAARRFVADILDDLLPLFPGPWWHAGADEYLGIVSTPADYLRYPQLEAYADRRYGAAANGKDAILDFVNFVAERVHAAGKEIRVWSDGAGGGSAVKVDPHAVIEWWENLHSSSPPSIVASGHRILNVGWWPLYYVTGGVTSLLRTTEQDMYERWSPSHFEGPYTPRWALGVPLTAFDLDSEDFRNLGATLAVWNDDPAAEGAKPAAVTRGITPRLRILAQQTWGSAKLVASYEDFTRIPG